VLNVRIIRKSLSLQGIFEFWEQPKIERGLNQVNKMGGPFCNGLTSHKLSIITHHAQGHCYGGESTCQARVWVFASKKIPVT
jgi:hypothetical protein